MWLDLNQSNVQKDDQKFIPMLTNLQANILKFHGRKFAHHLFFVINNPDNTKSWIKDFASSTITSAKAQLDDVQKHHDTGTDGGTVFTLSLSGTGFGKLGKMPDIENSTPLINGLRGSKARLND